MGMSPRCETVGVSVIQRLEALVKASGRAETFDCGLNGEVVPAGVGPAIRHTTDDRTSRREEVFVEAKPIGT